MYSIQLYCVLLCDIAIDVLDGSSSVIFVYGGQIWDFSTHMGT